MSILIYAESAQNKLKKQALELCSYGRALADQLGTEAIALVVNLEDHAQLSAHGIQKIISITDADLQDFKAKSYASLIEVVSKQVEAKTIVISSSADAQYLAPILTAQLQASYASNVVALPESTEPFVVKRKAFSSKAFSFTALNNEFKVLSLAKNSFGAKENQTDSSEIEYTFEGPRQENLEVLEVAKSSGQISIADADIVVSAGRGLKGPENWTMIEDLAEVLGAATACSKPVSDLGWRPHSEHVGQTGKPVASNLYIAIGISGAIQHLAGINASKVKVVINSDPEAPFFKAADYGVVGDAFEVVPQLIEKFKAFKLDN
ncbi:MAG: electron transfer flavoprotein subunit alpha/FixB family protein [Flavobacteriaceae bacterium]